MRACVCAFFKACVARPSLQGAVIDEKVVEEMKRFLTNHRYPDNLLKNEKINFRKRAQDFVVDEDGNLRYYKCKTTGLTQMVISSKEEKE